MRMKGARALTLAHAVAVADAGPEMARTERGAIHCNVTSSVGVGVRLWKYCIVSAAFASNNVVEPQLVGVDGCLAFRFIGVLGVHESARRAFSIQTINFSAYT